MIEGVIPKKFAPRWPEAVSVQRGPSKERTMRIKITQDHEFYMDGFKLTQLKAGDILDVTESNADALRCEGVAIELKVQPPTVETKKRRGKS